MKTVFDFSSYKAFMGQVLGPSNQRTGLRSALAKHLGCQTAYVSQVLKGGSHLSLEQAYRFCSFAELDTTETRFFLLLLQRERAGSQELEVFFEEQLEAIRAERQKIASRVKTTRELSGANQAKYYSDWTFAAIHMALSLPGLRTRASLAQHFGFSVDKISETLSFLEETGLAEIKGEEYFIGPAHLHLPDSSPHILRHHTNWRLQALKSMDSRKSSNLHYSVVYSISREDVLKVREALMNVIKENLKTVAPSPEEILVCNTIDLFEV